MMILFRWPVESVPAYVVLIFGELLSAVLLCAVRGERHTVSGF